MTYLYAVIGDEVTDATDTGSTEIGTKESVTTGIYTTEGMIHLSDVRRFFAVQLNRVSMSTMYFIWVLDISK